MISKGKILNITAFPVYPPNYGGGVGFYYLPIELIKRGFEINFVTYKEQNKNINYSEFEEKFKNNIYISKKNKLCSFFSFYPYSANRFRPNKKERAEIIKNIKREKYNVFIFHGPQSAHYFYFLRDIIKSQKMPMVYYSHNIESDYLYCSFRNSKNLIKKLFYFVEYLKMKNFERKIVKEFDLIFTVSPNDKIKLSLINPKAKIKWVRPIFPQLNEDNKKILPENITNQLNKFEYKILFTGLLSNENNKNGIKWFVQSVMPFLQKYLNFCFIIVGRDPTRDVLSLAQQYDNILIFPNVDSLAPYYHIADLVVIPLFINAGVKIKLIEALKYKKKIVSTLEGVSGSGLDKIIPITNTPEEFAQKCLDVLTNRIDFNPIWEEFFKLYDNNKITDEVEEELTRLISQK